MHICIYIYAYICMETAFLGRLFDRVDLMKPVSKCPCVRTYVRAYVRTSVHKRQCHVSNKDKLNFHTPSQQLPCHGAVW